MKEKQCLETRISFPEAQWNITADPATKSLLVCKGVPILSVITAAHVGVLSSLELLAWQNPSASEPNIVFVMAIIFSSLQIISSGYSLLVEDNRLKTWGSAHLAVGVGLTSCWILGLMRVRVQSSVDCAFEYALALDSAFCLVMSLLLLLPETDGDQLSEDPLIRSSPPMQQKTICAL